MTIEVVRLCGGCIQRERTVFYGLLESFWQNLQMEVKTNFQVLKSAIFHVGSQFCHFTRSFGDFVGRQDAKKF